MLSGNSNIVRIPSKKFVQTEIIVSAINKLAKVSKHSNISNRILLVSYDSENDATIFFPNDVQQFGVEMKPTIKLRKIHFNHEHSILLWLIGAALCY